MDKEFKDIRWKWINGVYTDEILCGIVNLGIVVVVYIDKGVASWKGIDQ